MKRKILTVLMIIGASLLFFRMGGPAAIFGTTGLGTFGPEYFNADGTATALLDADFRFFGVLLVGLGFIFLWALRDVEARSRLINILCVMVFVGASARVYSYFVIGNPGQSGIIPILIEFPLAISVFVVKNAIVARGPRGRS